MSLESVSSDKPDPKDEGDEAIISMSVAGEVTDTSIVEMGRSRPQFQYTREELMKIKGAPLSKRRPDCLDSAYNNKHGIWDPERWHLDRKRSETPSEEEPTNRNDHVPENHAKRRSGDPRERIRKEQDGIVLSPQRRSFNSGCFVNVSQPATRRPESPLGKSEVPHREPVRRIGSGRILNRDMWDFRSENDKLDSERSEFNFRPGGGGPLRDRDNRDNREAGRGDPMRDRDNIRDRDDRVDRYDRRSFSRDFGDRDRDRERGLERNERNQQNDRDKDRGRDRRYGNDRRRTYGEPREPEEPEWFSSGPTSQHDTIELRGFEDTPEEKTNNTTKGKKQSPAQKKRAKKAAEKEEKHNENHSSGPKGRSTPNSMEQPINVGGAPHSPILELNEQQSPELKEKLDESKTISLEQNSNATEKSSGKKQETKPPDFNLDDFLKSDTFPGVSGLLTNGVGSNIGSGSRFSQWFKRESPVQQPDSRKSSIQDELLNNLLNEINEPNIKIPSVTESNAYFAPISPANTTNHTASTTGVKLLEMLQRGKKPSQNGQGDVAANPVVQMMKNSSIKDIEQTGKVVSLEELEARMRGGPPPPASNEPPRVSKTDNDISAFKKLMAQMNGGQAIPATNGPFPQKQQPITLMQWLNTQLKSQTPVGPQQVAEPIRPPNINHVGPFGPVQHPHQSQMQHENLMKVLQVQQQQQQQQQKQRQEQQILSMMIGGQRMMGASPIPQDVQMLVNSAPATRQLLERPEAQAIIHGLQQGEITRHHLIQQLQNPAMQHRHREVLVNILKFYGGNTPRTMSPHASVPTPQDHMLQQMLYQQQQQQQQQQQRIPSPMNNVMPHRVPSPRELAMHTQSIIQNALIKKKLEEQRENYRKRQEQQQHQQQKHQPHQNAPSPVNSPAKQNQSPTPLAFTPTSVLRKMTAEKEPEGSNDPSKMISQNPATRRDELSVIADFAHQVALVAAGESRLPSTRSQPPVHPTWQNPAVKQHPGRPIVKGGGGTQFQYSGNVDFQQQQKQQQQQQRATSGMYGNPTARSKHTMVAPLPHSNAPQFNVASNSVMSQRSNQMTSQIKAQQVQSHLVNLQQQQQQQQQRTINPQIHLALNQNYNSSRNDGRVIRSQQLNIGVGRQTSPGLGFMGSTGGDLSPTSNQLARWFSPELLAQARAGKLPELGQTNLMSVEELERSQHASTTVHN